MADNVIPVDFGKEYNESAQRLARLMGLVEKQQAELAADPKRFLDEAHDQIVMLRREMRRLTDAMRRPCITHTFDQGAVPTRASDDVRVMKDDYQRWRAGDDVVRDWIAKGLV